MIVTEHFVYIHTSRHGGTFVNDTLLKYLPGARQIGYHYPLRRLPPRYEHLPVIGFIRNPYSFYVSLFHNYRRKKQFVYQAASSDGSLEFKQTIANLLTLGRTTPESAALRRRLIAAAPWRVYRVLGRAVEVGVPSSLSRLVPRYRPGGGAVHRTPALEKRDFRDYPDVGYHTWLFRRMHTDRAGVFRGNLGRFEDLRSELLRLFRETGVAVTQELEDHVMGGAALNVSGDGRLAEHYDDELAALVATQDASLLHQFAYTLP